MSELQKKLAHRRSLNGESEEDFIVSKPTSVSSNLSAPKPSSQYSSPYSSKFNQTTEKPVKRDSDSNLSTIMFWKSWIESNFPDAEPFALEYATALKAIPNIERLKKNISFDSDFLRTEVGILDKCLVHEIKVSYH